MEPETPYRVESSEGTFVVKDPSDRIVLRCQDEASAEHYVVMLAEAYRRGYRQGFRDARA